MLGKGWKKTLKSILSGSYPEVSVYEAKNAVADYIEDYNDCLPHFFNDQVRVLLTRCTTAFCRFGLTVRFH